MPLSNAAFKTILVVDDSADVRMMIKRTLEARAYLVYEAPDGQQAVQMAQIICPDLIIMDLNMPFLDGLAATEQIRQCRLVCRDVPIIAITAYDTIGIEEAVLEAGCNAYIRKPIEGDELTKVVDGYLFAPELGASSGAQ